MFDIDDEILKAEKRLKRFINQLVKDAKQKTAEDFNESRRKLFADQPVPTE